MKLLMVVLLLSVSSLAVANDYDDYSLCQQRCPANYAGHDEMIKSCESACEKEKYPSCLRECDSRYRESSEESERKQCKEKC
jgi:hypothetical protein